VEAPGEAGVLDASWTAPTTNTDGSRLTALASYRVYYGVTTSPCPGPSFVQGASSTTAPSPDQAVSVRIRGLATGTRYYVAVSAVDMSGNQSACSPAVSAVAQIDFAVNPTGSVNFGTVNRGSVADRILTVSNTRVGTVSGTVSTSAPFSIVSGSSFTLAGLGATHAVTVRFTPTTSGTASANVNVSADGDSVSRLVTGTGIGVGPETTRPTVAITSLTPGTMYSTSASVLTLAGRASDNVGVTQVTWANSRGGSGIATGTTSWTSSGIGLQLGSNVLTVTARDAAGNTAAATVTVTRTGEITRPTVTITSTARDAAGNTAAATVTRTGETVRPTVTITSPTSSTTYTTGALALALAGQASDNVGVTQVTWANSRGGSGIATGTTSWTSSGIDLQPGLNVLTVTARDAAGNTATATLTVTRDTVGEGAAP
jgi:Glucodextranase, domain B